MKISPFLSWSGVSLIPVLISGPLVSSKILTWVLQVLLSSATPAIKSFEVSGVACVKLILTTSTPASFSSITFSSS